MALGEPQPDREPPAQAPVAPAAEDRDTRRRFGRIRVSGARASLGRIIDISGGGMRVASRSMGPAPREGATLPVQIDVGDEEWMSLTCRVAWVRSAGVLKREIGLAFVEIEEDVKRSLLAMAHTSGSAGGFRLIAESEREHAD